MLVLYSNKIVTMEEECMALWPSGKASVLCSYIAVAMVMLSIEARSFGCYSYIYTYFNKGCFGNHALVFENYCLGSLKQSIALYSVF